MYYSKVKKNQKKVIIKEGLTLIIRERLIESFYATFGKPMSDERDNLEDAIQQHLSPRLCHNFDEVAPTQFNRAPVHLITVLDRDLCDKSKETVRTAVVQETVGDDRSHCSGSSAQDNFHFFIDNEVMEQKEEERNLDSLYTTQAINILNSYEGMVLFRKNPVHYLNKNKVAGKRRTIISDPVDLWVSKIESKEYNELKLLCTMAFKYVSKKMSSAFPETMFCHAQRQIAGRRADTGVVRFNYDQGHSRGR